MGLSKSFKKNFGRGVLAVGTLGESEVLRGAARLLSPSKQTVNQTLMETPEQRRARERLSGFSETGKYDFGGGRGFTAGEAYSGSLGDFNMTPEELAAQGRLSSLLARGRPEIFGTGEKALTDLLTSDKYDPYSATGEFAPFREAVLRETQAAQGRAKGAAAYSGNLYSKSTGKNLANIESEGNLQLQSKLAQLFSEYTGRKINAIPQALNYATTGQALDMAPIEAGYNYGGVSRNLKTADAQSRLAEFLRQRQELMLPIQTAGNLATTNANYGVPSITTLTPSPWMDLLKLGAKAVAAYLGARG